jgi:hypothetical protein
MPVSLRWTTEQVSEMTDLMEIQKLSRASRIHHPRGQFG